MSDGPSLVKSRLPILNPPGGATQQVGQLERPLSDVDIERH